MGHSRLFVGWFSFVFKRSRREIPTVDPAPLIGRRRGEPMKNRRSGSITAARDAQLERENNNNNNKNRRKHYSTTGSTRRKRARKVQRCNVAKTATRGRRRRRQRRRPHRSAAGRRLSLCRRRAPRVSSKEKYVDFGRRKSGLQSFLLVRVSTVGLA